MFVNSTAGLRNLEPSTHLENHYCLSGSEVTKVATLIMMGYVDHDGLSAVTTRNKHEQQHTPCMASTNPVACEDLDQNSELGDN